MTKPLPVYAVERAPLQRARTAAKSPIGAQGVLLVAIIPILLLVNTEGQITGAFLAELSITLLSGYMLAKAATANRPRLFQTTFWIFVYCWLGIAATAQLRANRFPWYEQALSQIEMWRAVGIVFIGTISYVLGTLNARQNKLPDSRSRLKDPSMRRYLTLTILGLLLSAYSVQKHGGVAETFKTRGEDAESSSLDKASLDKTQSLVLGQLQGSPPL